MKTFYVITDTKNSKEHTMYVGDLLELNHDIEFALKFETEEEAEGFIEENEIEEWAGVEEEEYFFTLEKTDLTKLPSGHGHWKIKAESNGYSHTITTNNSQLIDDAFNSEEGDTSYYDSIEEAREAIIELINE